MDLDHDGNIDISKEELFRFTERLLQEDSNNCARFFDFKLQQPRQGKEDVCDEPLFHDVNGELFELDTVKKLIALHDNYKPLVSEEEDVTREETQEEYDFLDACLDTQVMKVLHEFLISNGLLNSEDKADFKQILHQLWFSLYPRSHRVKGSCAFEHVFLGELKRNRVKGFHNWLFFLLEERKGELNYYGFYKALEFEKTAAGANQGGILKTIFEWESGIKPISTIFIGASPELEMAIYTLCVLLKPNRACKISLGGKEFNIQTYMLTYDGRKYLSTAYPAI